jgi:hypothetical protein
MINKTAFKIMQGGTIYFQLKVPEDLSDDRHTLSDYTKN